MLFNYIYRQIANMYLLFEVCFNFKITVVTIIVIATILYVSITILPGAKLWNDLS